MDTVRASSSSKFLVMQWPMVEAKINSESVFRAGFLTIFLGPSTDMLCYQR